VGNPKELSPSRVIIHNGNYQSFSYGSLSLIGGAAMQEDLKEPKVKVVKFRVPKKVAFIQVVRSNNYF
jgi:hypothetical protein